MRPKPGPVLLDGLGGFDQSLAASAPAHKLGSGNGRKAPIKGTT